MAAFSHTDWCSTDHSGDLRPWGPAPEIAAYEQDLELQRQRFEEQLAHDKAARTVMMPMTMRPTGFDGQPGAVGCQRNSVCPYTAWRQNFQKKSR